MRQEIQHWNQVRVYTEMILAGEPQTGKTVRAKLQRLSDGQWWNHAGLVWGVAAVDNVMTEIDSTNLAGLYGLILPDSAFEAPSGYDDAFPGYVAYISETTRAMKETLFIATHRRSPHDDVVTDHAEVGTFGLLHLVTKSLVGGNIRELDQLYDLSNRLLTWTTATYANATDADLDQNRLETYEGAAAYTDGKLSSYLLKKV